MKFMEKLNRAISLSEMQTKIENDGDMHLAYFDISFTHEGKEYFVRPYAEAVLFFPKNKKMYRSSDVVEVVGVCSFTSVSRMTGQLHKTLAEINKDGDDKDPSYYGACMGLRDAVKFTEEELRAATERRQAAVERYQKSFA
jgi:hypothetical protein